MGSPRQPVEECVFPTMYAWSVWSGSELAVALWPGSAGRLRGRHSELVWGRTFGDADLVLFSLPQLLQNLLGRNEGPG